MSHWINDQYHNERLTKIIADKTKLQRYYDLIDLTLMQIPKVTKEIAKELIETNIDCLICKEFISEEDEIWYCKTCWKIVHFNCIYKWIPTACVTLNERYYNEILWKCPHCNTHNQSDNIEYIKASCYCRRNFFLYNEEGKQLSQFTIPHGCQSMCQVYICKHIRACPLLCHPGPHVQCKKKMFVICFCGKTMTNYTCTSGVTEFSCKKICKKMLSCNKHYCNKECHKEPCQSELLTEECDECYNESKDSLDNMIKEKESNEGIDPNINLSFVLTDYIFNGELPCHRHVSPLKIEQNRLYLQRILKSNGNFQHYLMNFIPLCKEQVVNSCNCQSNSKYTDCYLLNYNESLLKFLNIEKEAKVPKCNTICYSYKQCHNHQCLRKCCELLKALISTSSLPDPRGLHICHLKCGKFLNCKKHYCEDNCHSGKCIPCKVIVTNGTKICNCGKTTLQSPFVCGFQIQCILICEKRLPCGHYCKNDCHEGDCEPCDLYSTRTCACKKTTIVNASCSIPDDSLNCTIKCGIMLRCKVHFCPIICHIHDESFDDNHICNLKCKRNLLCCEHTCQLKCHGESPCDESACEIPMVIQCKCGEIKQMIPCYKSKLQKNIKKVLECGKECYQANSLNKIRKSFVGIDNLTNEKILLLYPSYYSDDKAKQFIEETPLKYDITLLSYAKDIIDIIIKIEDQLIQMKDIKQANIENNTKIPLDKNHIEIVIDWLVIYHRLKIQKYTKGIKIINIEECFKQKYRLSLIALLFKHNLMNDNQRNARKCKIYHPFMFSILLRGQREYKTIEASVNSISFINRNDYYLQKTKEEEFYLDFFNVNLGKKTYDVIKSKGEYQECFSQEYHHNEGDDSHLNDYLTDKHYYNYLNDGYDEKYYQETYKKKEEEKNSKDADGFILINKKKKAK